MTGSPLPAPIQGGRGVLPEWIRPAERALLAASSRIRPIRAVTPTNICEQLARLLSSYERGEECAPQFRYEPPAVGSEVIRALEQLGAFLDTQGPLGALYADRARELALDASLVEAVDLPRLRSVASARFVGRTPEDLTDRGCADRLAASFVAAEDTNAGTDQQGPQAYIRTDDPSDSRSLYRRMVGEVGAHRLAIRVIVQPELASLAATGDGVIFVAQNRWVRAREIERTVLHEVEGHAIPRSVALTLPLAIFAIGTARGLDDQEGRALLLEKRSGFLDRGRQRELGLRHMAAAATLDGASFVDVMRLLRARGEGIEGALRICARVQRGGGLAREIVYLPALLRVERAFAIRPALERTVKMGRVGVHAAAMLAHSMSHMCDLPVATVA